MARRARRAGSTFRTSPGTRSRRTRRERSRIRRASSTCRSAPPSTRRPRSYAGRWLTAADAPGYPLTVGTADLRAAICEWFERRRGVPGLDPDARPADHRQQGARRVAADAARAAARATSSASRPSPTRPTTSGRGSPARRASWPSPDEPRPAHAATTPKLLWLNSPGNPNGQVLGVPHLRKVVAWAREHGVVVASDECYAELDWREGQVGTATPSILHPDVCGGYHEGLLAVYSLSKQSNLAGYRAAFVAGDPALVARDPRGAQARRHDHAHARPARHGGRPARRHPRRRRSGRHTAGGASCCSPRSPRRGCGSTTPRPGSTSGPRARRTAGQRFPSSPTAGSSSRPGSFYGAAGSRHVRIALTATDERIAAACSRL